MKSACLETHEMWCGEFSVRVGIAVVVVSASCRGVQTTTDHENSSFEKQSNAIVTAK